MQIRLKLVPVRPFVIPLSYHYQLQSAVYKALELSPQYAAFLHDFGYGKNTRPFRLFTFGELNGNYSVRDKKMWISDVIGFEIRSVSEEFCSVLDRSFRVSPEIKLFNEKMQIMSSELSDKRITSDSIRTVTSSPIVTRITDDKGKTFYFSPDEPQFYDLIQKNFRKKYAAFTDRETDTGFVLRPLGECKKIVTRYKDIWITAYRGSFEMRGEPWALDFAYQTGLGSYSSQGFGMFDVR